MGSVEGIRELLIKGSGELENPILLPAPHSPLPSAIGYEASAYEPV
jgi:hypothetical protein